MEVHIKSFNVDAQVKQRGLEFEVRSADGATHLGDCFVTMTGIRWCEGRTTYENGVQLPWADLRTILQSKGTRRAAIRAAGQVD